MFFDKPIKEQASIILAQAEEAGVNFPKHWSGEEGRVTKCRTCIQFLMAVPKLEDGDANIDQVLTDLKAKYGVSSSAGGGVKEESSASSPPGKTAPSDTDEKEEAAPKAAFKDPSDMTPKQLQAAIKKAGLTDKAKGFTEKSEFVELLTEEYKTNPPKKAAPRKRKAKEEKEGDGTASGSEAGSPKKKKEPVSFECSANTDVYTAIREIGGEYYKAGENFKGGVYMKAAKAIREHDAHLTTSKEAQKLKGIGKGVGALIEEFAQQGYIDKLEKLKAGEV